MHDETLSTLLAAERPRPREAFAAELDARAAARFPPRPRPARARRRRPAFLRRPLLPAAAATLVAGLIALVVGLGAGGGPHVSADTAATSAGATADAPKAVVRRAFEERSAHLARPHALLSPAPAAPQLDSTRKVERSASVELGADPARVDDVAQAVLGVAARFGGIVDQSSVQTRPDGGRADFQLRIPAARLQSALAALSGLPDARVLSRSDDALDVNQAYVSVRRRLANARAERAGVVRALRNADTEDETLRLRARLDALERTIARAERSQRTLDRRVDYSRVSVAVRGSAHGGAGAAGAGGAGSFTLGAAGRDALRVLEVAAGVVVVAAAALLPVALLALLAWPLARALRRRRREAALDAA